ncbi:hypothetical protein WR25_23049 [Diploscapter pachys]|uniref:Uncharacterized protein n=1 Tax=Diploscapter pachys TaxID=2018661 RepID=A0A2A2JD29_9BILA|nr:hypothetical protein WR25_23049 [Diploscapter pachys]
MSGEIPVVVATIAFGTGIDKADQRQESLYSRSQRQNGEAHESFGYEPRQKKEEEKYSGFENGMNSNVVAKRVNWQMEELRGNDSSHSHTALDDSSSQADNQQKAVDIEYNSCYLQSKTLSSYNHKAAQVLSAIRNATKNGTEYDFSSASAI